MKAKGTALKKTKKTWTRAKVFLYFSKTHCYCTVKQITIGHFERVGCLGRFRIFDYSYENLLISFMENKDENYNWQHENNYILIN